MQVSLVLTVIGPDRPGIVEQLAQTIAAHEANWLESRMAHLAGQFAGILRARVPASHADRLERALVALGPTGLRITVARDAATEEPDERLRLSLELVGHDRPGIVRDISGVLAARGVNVEELATECEAAPMSGGVLFRATAELRAPRGVTLDELHRALEELASDLMVDVTLREAADP